jgi:hypothetical protein
MNASSESPSARELLDRSRVLTSVMLDKPDDAAPNYVLLLILSEQLKMLNDAFEAEEVQRMTGDPN